MVLLTVMQVLVMEYINGARIDDKEYLARENIDRNLVALELARVFSRMVHLNGWFHAVCFIRCLTYSRHNSYFHQDPHLGKNSLEGYLCDCLMRFVRKPSYPKVAP